MPGSLWFICGVIGLASTTGCATYSTINNAAPGTPKFYSGTRLNVHAINKDEYAVRKFRAPLPLDPQLDLPLSMVADTFLLPLTMPAIMYEAVFK